MCVDKRERERERRERRERERERERETKMRREVVIGHEQGEGPTSQNELDTIACARLAIVSYSFQEVHTKLGGPRTFNIHIESCNVHEKAVYH